MQLFAIDALAWNFHSSTNSSTSPNSIPNQRPMVVAAAHPLAVAAGMDILREGGDATDAAIAVQAMLGLVEPQSSGLGGGAFMLRYDANSKRIEVYDGREIAPASANARMFLDQNGRPINRGLAMTSGKATGVPGVLAMLKSAHNDHGKLAWSKLFVGATKSAQNGFPVSARLDRFVRADIAQSQAPDFKKYFIKGNGELVKQGDILRNPAYAVLTSRIAQEGIRAFYSGEVANNIVNKVSEEPMPALMTSEDISNYTPIKRRPICIHYRAVILCTAPPPSSGVSLLQLMLILKQTNIGMIGPQDPQSWFLFAEASRLMFADRDAWIGDPNFINVPVAGLISDAYIKKRRQLIKNEINPLPQAGMPNQTTRIGRDATLEPAGTSHFVIIDKYGNAVSMTTTVESFFGSGRMVNGFFLNNQMTDFSFIPTGPNTIAPNKRPRSSMSPVIILDQNHRLLGALGSPGGSAILAYISKTLIGVLDWGLSMQDAINLPNLVARGDRFNGEASQMSPQIVSALAARGINVQSGSGEDSGLHGFIWRNNAWDAGADKRRDGTVLIEEAVQNK